MLCLPFHLAHLVLLPALSWRIAIGATLATTLILLALVVLWLAFRRLESASDDRDVGDDGFLGLVTSEPVGPAQPAADPQPSRTARPAVNVPPLPQAAPEPGLPAEIRPRVTAQDGPDLTAAATAPVAAPSTAQPPPHGTPATVATRLPADPDAEAPSLSALPSPSPSAQPLDTTQPLDTRTTTSPKDVPPVRAPATSILSVRPTTARLTPATTTTPLAQDIREQFAQASLEEQTTALPPSSVATSPQPVPTTHPPVTEQHPSPAAAKTAVLRENRLTEQLPAQRKVLRPPQAPAAASHLPPPAVAPAAMPSVPTPPPVRQAATPPEPALVPLPPPAAAEITPPHLPDDGRPTGIGSKAVWLAVMFALFVVLLGSVVVIVSPTVRNRILPPSWAERVAALPRGLGLEAAPPSVPVKQVEVYQYANTYSSIPKGATGKIVRMVTMAGLVKNITDHKLYDLQVEIELYPREPDGAPPERRIIYLMPNLLEPGQEGRYTLTVADADYRQFSLKRVVSGTGKDLREIPAVFIRGLLEPPAVKPASDRPTPARRR